MHASFGDNGASHGGILIYSSNSRAFETARRGFLNRLEELELDRCIEQVEASDSGRRSIRFRLRAEFEHEWAPGRDTMQLCRKLDLDTHGRPDDLEREILLAMMLGPLPFAFPSYDELASAVRIRKNIVEGARKTALAFHTTEAERPADCWTYDKDRGFTILPGKSLITALRKATQPQESGKLYSFSCYRATEYVILLGVAQELAACNPELYGRLQTLWQTRAIMSSEFHDVFLREYGTMNDPLPRNYFVPGDRTWFRNPDEHSSDVAGYEGSWVMYLGDGLFTNFWKRDQPYTMTAKCLEMYHWRNATYRDDAGELQIDETIVENNVAEARKDPAEVERILKIMLRYREPSGVYLNGGCIDTTREYLRRVCPGTADLALPAA